MTGLERLYALTDPDLVKACLDVFWVQHGGRDPVQFTRQYRDRIGYVHLKDLQYVGPEPRRPGILAGGLDLGPERYATLMTEAEFAELGDWGGGLPRNLGGAPPAQPAVGRLRAGPHETAAGGGGSGQPALSPGHARNLVPRRGKR